jgi:hypothetical protein
MGTITLKVPQDIHLEYQIDSSKMMVQLLDWLKPLKPQPVQNDKEKAYAAAMQDYLSRPAKPLKNSQESYPPREALYDRGKNQRLPNLKVWTPRLKLMALNVDVGNEKI